MQAFDRQISPYFELHIFKIRSVDISMLFTTKDLSALHTKIFLNSEIYL